ncbi:uncharacterized protein LOC100123420 [Nasonia vitripennis]|uniref:Uncharacterized protein n=1 Tax=Nasonia vitripennis TaxID=7425 RepID=A0A7M7LJV0_NASVI|nr:uncharacterized protein LOC100123420 [Nasonia vitripennis]
MSGRMEAILLALLTCSLMVGQADSGELLARRKRYVVFPEGSSFSVALCMTVHTLTPDNIFTEGLNWGISYDLPNESKPELAPFLQLRKDRLKLDSPDSYGRLSKGKYGASAQQQVGYYQSSPIDKIKYGDYYKPDYGARNNEAKYNKLRLAERKMYSKADYHYLQRRHRRDLYNKLEVVVNAMGYDGRTCILRALCEAAQRFMPRGNSLVEEMMRIVFALPLKRVFSFEPEEHRVYTSAHKAGHEGHDCPALFPGCSFSLIDMALGKYNSDAEDYDEAAALQRYTMK